MKKQLDEKLKKVCDSIGTQAAAEKFEQLSKSIENEYDKRIANGMSELEAWGLVRRAVQNGIYGAQKEFDALPPVVQQCVGSPSQLKEWALLDEDVVASVVASNFQRSYRARAAQAKEFLALPADVRSAMQQLGAGLQLKSLEG